MYAVCVEAALFWKKKKKKSKYLFMISFVYLGLMVNLHVASAHQTLMGYSCQAVVIFILGIQVSNEI